MCRRSNGAVIGQVAAPANISGTEVEMGREQIELFRETFAHKMERGEFCGVPIEELNREELLGIIGHLVAVRDYARETRKELLEVILHKRKPLWKRLF